jgi:hypothetical protein
MREYFRHRRLALPAAFAHKFRSRLQTSIYLVTSAGVLIMFFGSLALLAQKSPHYQLDLDLLVQLDEAALRPGSTRKVSRSAAYVRSLCD